MVPGRALRGHHNMVGRSRMGLLFIADNNGIIKVAGGLWTKYLPFVVFMDIFLEIVEMIFLLEEFVKIKPM